MFHVEQSKKMKWGIKMMASEFLKANLMEKVLSIFVRESYSLNDFAKKINGFDDIHECMKAYPVKMKKMLKQACLEIAKNDDSDDWKMVNEKIVNQWAKFDKEYGESRTYMFLVKANSEKEVKSLFHNHTVSPYPLLINSDYDCTGKWWSNGMDIKMIGKGLYLAHKSYSLDV